MYEPKSHSPQSEFQKIHSEAGLRMEAAIADLRAIAQEVDAEMLLTHLFLFLGMGPIDSYRESAHGTVSAKMEHAAYHLIPFFGVSAGKVTAPHIDRAAQAIETAFRDFMVKQTFEPVPDNDIDRLIRQFNIDVAVVRGSAYPEQTSREVAEIQGRFESWFTERLGIGPRRASALLRPIVRTIESKANEWMHVVRAHFQKGEQLWKEIHRRRRKGLLDNDRGFLRAYKTARQAGFAAYEKILPDTPPQSVPVSYREIDFDPAPTAHEWKALISLIGTTPQDRLAMTSPTDISNRPLFVLSNDRVLLCDISNALDRLWQAFDSAAKAEGTFYTGRYAKWKAEWLEKRTAEILTRLFPARCVYRNLYYPTSDGGTAELDIAVYWPPFLILCEAKSAQFRLTSQLREIGRLSTDLKRNLEEAFDQARRAATYIDSVAQATLTEKGTGRTLQIRRTELKKTYLMTVSLHHLSFVVTRLAALQPLGLFKDMQFPFATSIADLDVVTEFCPGPDVLLHYLDRRMALERCSIEVQGDELSLFGAYLKMRLHPERLGFTEKRPPNHISLVGFGEPFDFIMEYRRGDRTEQTSVGLEVPIEIQQILGELRRRNEQLDARWIAFWLLDLRDHELHVLARILREISSQVIDSGRLRWYAQTFDDLVVLVMAARDLSVDILRERTLQRTLLEKYRRKVTRSIGFGIYSVDGLRPFDSAVLSQGPWEYDSQLEQLVKTDVPIPARGSRLPGPNAPCICGSQKKFKKCCARTIEAELRNKPD